MDFRKSKTEFIVYDAMCGSGKTSLVKELMLQSPSEQYIYITPFLSECHAMAATIADDEGLPEYDQTSGLIKYLDKDTSVLKFKHPTRKHGKGTKEFSLANLMYEGSNIVSTHQLFTHMGINSLENAGNYTLIIDEALSVYEENNEVSRAEVGKLLEIGLLVLDEDGITLRFNREHFGVRHEGDDDQVKETSYEGLAMMCDLGQLILIDGKTLVWEMSASMLRKFKKVIICTYLFEGQLFASYLKKHNIKYELIKFGRSVNDVKHLIDVLSNPAMNSLGAGDTALSKSFFEKPSTRTMARDGCRKHLHTVMVNWKTKADDRMFTCFKTDAAHIANKRYGRNWLPFNSRATNDYGHIHHVAYLVNVYPSPILVKAAASKETELSVDLYSLGELIQFLFRSAIRNGEKVKFYIPSSRMRNLLFRWLEGEFE